MEKSFETQEEAENYANSLNFVIDYNYKSCILNISEVPNGYNRYETKVLHPLTLEYSPFLAQHYSIETERKERIDDFTNEQKYRNIFVNNILNSICVKSVNLYNKDTVNVGGFWASDNRLIENNTYYYTAPIFFEKQKTYKWKIANTMGNNLYLANVDINNNLIKTQLGYKSEDGKFLLFTPESSSYYSINIGQKYDVEFFMVCLEDEYPENYVSYTFTLQQSLIKDIKVSKENTDFWQFEKSINLFNKDNIFPGYWAGNTIQEATKLYHSGPIYLTSNCTYKFPSLKRMLGNNHNVNRVSENNEFIYVDYADMTEEDVYRYFTPPISGYYSFNVGSQSDLETFMVCLEDEYPDHYVEYYNRWTLPDLSLQNNSLPNDISYNKLYGKKVSFNGDSICCGAGHSGGYGKIIAERNNMIYLNRAVGGGTITAELYTNSGAARHWISRDISNMDPTSDYVILEGGVNDASLNLTLGEITSGFTSEFDDTTYCGAFESMIKQCYDLFPNAKLGFIIVHQMSVRFNPGGEFYEKTIEILEKWGVPYLNLSIKCPPLLYIPSLKETYTHNADGWHPNELGYKTFYCDKIEEFMKSL